MLVAFAFFLAFAAYAENAQLGIPYVSGLRAEVEGSAIKLLWQDTTIRGARYVIFRYSKQLSRSDWQKAKRLAVVPAGQESYIDQPTAKRPYYYAVLVEEGSGKIRPLFIPFRNVTTDPVEIKGGSSGSPSNAEVTALRAHAAGSSIELSFHSSAKSRELVVYRGTAPIDNEAQLLKSVSVGVIPSSQTSFQDTPVPGIPYYYAVIDSAMLASGKVALIPGQNTTRSGVTVPIRTNGNGEIIYATKRPRPLPFLTLTTNPQTGAPLPGSTSPGFPQKTALTKKTADAVHALVGSLPTKKPPKMHPVILDADKGVVKGGGEEYALKDILDGPFKAGKWKAAVAALDAYLAIRHSKAIEKRARFYLAEAHYFTGAYRQAMLEFLLVEKSYYAQAKPWMDALFTKLKTKQTGQS